jgi:hypothetical protein
MDWPQPWFDDHAAEVYPAYHVLRGLAAGAGRSSLKTTLSNGSAVQTVAWRANGRVVAWLANLTPEPQTISVDGLPARRGRLAVLDEASFVAAITDPDALAGLARDSELARLELGPYAVARLEAGG